MKPRKADRPVEKSISLPQTLTARIDLILYSEIDGRVPHGAWSRFTQQALENELRRIEGAADERI